MIKKNDKGCQDASSIQYHTSLMQDKECSAQDKDVWNENKKEMIL